MKRNRIRAAVIVLSLLLMFSGCSAPIRSGVVIDKNHRSAWVQIISIYNGKSFTYSTVYHPEQYEITIEGINENGETERRTVDISAELWDDIEIGDDWEDIES